MIWLLSLVLGRQRRQRQQRRRRLRHWPWLTSYDLLNISSSSSSSQQWPEQQGS